MSRVTLISTLAAFTLLIGCHSATNTVRNGYLDYNRTTTVGQALEHTFSNGAWKSFTTEKGVKIVEFKGSLPFKEEARDPGCADNLICAALENKLEADCNTGADALSYKAAHDSINLQLSEVNQRLDALNKQLDNAPQADFIRMRDDLYREGGEYKQLLQKRPQLQDQLRAIPDPRPACIDNAYKQHADTPLPITVQFSINSDGTFQYYADDMGWGAEKLLYNMYK